jgi:hypothetical protein
LSTAVAASRLFGDRDSNPLGLRPRLHAVVASRLSKFATNLDAGKYSAKKVLEMYNHFNDANQHFAILSRNN